MDKRNNKIHNDDIGDIHFVEWHMEESESTSVSESDFDNAFPNMLTKRFLDKQDLKMDM